MEANAPPFAQDAAALHLVLRRENLFHDDGEIRYGEISSRQLDVRLRPAQDRDEEADGLARGVPRDQSLDVGGNARFRSVGRCGRPARRQTCHRRGDGLVDLRRDEKVIRRRLEGVHDFGRAFPVPRPVRQQKPPVAQRLPLTGLARASQQPREDREDHTPLPGRRRAAPGGQRGQHPGDHRNSQGTREFAVEPRQEPGREARFGGRGTQERQQPVVRQIEAVQGGAMLLQDIHGCEIRHAGPAIRLQRQGQAERRAGVRVLEHNLRLQRVEPRMFLHRPVERQDAHGPVARFAQQPVDGLVDGRDREHVGRGDEVPARQRQPAFARHDQECAHFRARRADDGQARQDQDPVFFRVAGADRHADDDVGVDDAPREDLCLLRREHRVAADPADDTARPRELVPEFGVGRIRKREVGVEEDLPVRRRQRARGQLVDGEPSQESGVIDGAQDKLALPAGQVVKPRGGLEFGQQPRATFRLEQVDAEGVPLLRVEIDPLRQQPPFLRRFGQEVIGDRHPVSGRLRSAQVKEIHAPPPIRGGVRQVSRRHPLRRVLDQPGHGGEQKAQQLVPGLLWSGRFTSQDPARGLPAIQHRRAGQVRVEGGRHRSSDAPPIGLDGGRRGRHQRRIAGGGEKSSRGELIGRPPRREQMRDAGPGLDGLENPDATQYAGEQRTPDGFRQTVHEIEKITPRFLTGRELIGFDAFQRGGDRGRVPGCRFPVEPGRDRAGPVRRAVQRDHRAGELRLGQ